MNMSKNFSLFTILTSMFALTAFAGEAVAQNKRPQPETPKVEKRAPDGRQDAPPPRGPEDFRPRGGMGPGKGMGPKGFRPGPGGPDGFGAPRGMGARKQRGPGMMFFGLNLSDEQKTKIQAIMKSARPTDAQREEMKSLMMAARAGLLTEAQQARMKAARDERRTKGESIRTQLMGVLTPEQKGRLEERRAMQMRQRMRDRGPQNRRGGDGNLRKPGRRQGPAGDRQGPPPSSRKEEN